MRLTARWGVTALAAALVSVSLGCDREGGTDDGTVEFSERDKKRIARLVDPGDPPADETNAVDGDPRAAHLGQFLFFDERLSENGEVSCATCHQPDHGFSMPKRLGEGIGETRRHPPTLLNAAYSPWFNWDGEADSLWSQALGPLEDPDEHGFTRTQLVHLIAGDDELRQAYEAIFSELPDLEDGERFPEAARPVDDDPDHPHTIAWEEMREEDRESVNRVATNVTKAIAAYQTRLVRNEAPFDTFAEGLLEDDEPSRDAISGSAKRGLKLFVDEAGCARCHTGPNLTDGDFHNLGLGPREWLEAADEGRWEAVPALKESRFNARGDFSDGVEGKRAQWLEFLKRTSEDHGQFKTPTLRNVELTAPYMHGGHFETLEEVVQFYATLPETPEVGHREEMLEPLELDGDDIDDLVAFLESLTGEPLPAELTEQPDSPVR